MVVASMIKISKNQISTALGTEKKVVSVIIGWITMYIWYSFLHTILTLVHYFRERYLSAEPGRHTRAWYASLLYSDVFRPTKNSGLVLYCSYKRTYTQSSRDNSKLKGGKKLNQDIVYIIRDTELEFNVP